MTLAELRRRRQAAAARMQAAADAITALETAETTDADPAPMAAATAEFDAAQAAFDQASASVTRAEAVEAAQAAAAQGDVTPTATTIATTPAAPANPAHRGVSAGFMVQALAMARGDRNRAAAALEAAGHSQISAALSGATESAGGVTIPQAQAAELIDLLRARVVVRASGARTFPMPAGEIRHAKLIASASAGYSGENAAIQASEPQFGKIDQSFKKLTGLVPIGNSLLRHSSLQMATLVRDDLLKVMARREDLAFIRGDGSGNTPKGLRHWILPGNWIADVAGTAAAAEAIVRATISRIEDADVAMASPGWIMRASAKNYLASLRDGLGQRLFPSIEGSGTLGGYPIRTTSQIPDNLGAGGNETEVYFGDFEEAMIGDSMVLTIGTSDVAAFVDDQGNAVSAFQNDLTLMRAIAEHDFAPAHDEAFAGFNAVGWSL